MIRINPTLNLLAASFVVLALSGTAFAQTKSAEAKPCDAASYPTATARQECYEINRVIKTYYLTSPLQQSDANEILIALRNTLNQDVKLYLVPSQEAIVLSAPPDQQALAQKVIEDLDHPRKTWRLTYTLAESDGGKRIGIQHFSFVLADGQRTTLKQGSKVPVMTGSYEPKSDSQQTQFQYLDIGMNFDATISKTPAGIYLKTKVEQSAVGSPSEYGNASGPLASEPIIHQTSLEGSSIIVPGKPMTLGSVDVPGSTRHIDIEVVAEPVS